MNRHSSQVDLAAQAKTANTSHQEAAAAMEVSHCKPA